MRTLLHLLALALALVAPIANAALCDLSEYTAQMSHWMYPETPNPLPRVPPVVWNGTEYNFAWQLLPSDADDGSCDPAAFVVTHDINGDQSLRLATLPDSLSVADPDYNASMASVLLGAAIRGACRLGLLYPPTFHLRAMEALSKNRTEYAATFHVQPCGNALEDGQTDPVHWRGNRVLYDFSGRFRASRPGELAGAAGIRADPTERILQPQITLHGIQQMVDDPKRDHRATMTMTCEKFHETGPEDVGAYVAKRHVALFNGWAKPWELRPEGLEEIPTRRDESPDAPRVDPNCRRLFNASFAVDVPTGPVLAWTIIEVRDMDPPRVQNLPPLSDETLMPRQFSCAWEADEFLRRAAARYTTLIEADDPCAKRAIHTAFSYTVHPSTTACVDRGTLFRGTWAAEDGCGNAIRYTHTVAVHDRIPPMRRTDPGARGVQRCLTSNGNGAPLDAVHMAPGRVKVFDIAFLVDNVVRTEFEDNCGGGPMVLSWEADWHAVEHLKCTLHLQRPGSPPMTCVKLPDSAYPAIVFRGNVKLPGEGQEGDEERTDDPEDDEEAATWDWAKYFPAEVSIGRATVPVVVSDACGNKLEERTLVDLVFANTQEQCDVLGMSTPW